MIGDLVTDLKQWEKDGWEVIRVVSPRQSPETVREWRVAWIQETRRRVFVCPDPRALVTTWQWRGWDEPRRPE
ncbi:MAG: hypothetical protein V2G42_01085 [bacterium JZ-2024 1]